MSQNPNNPRVSAIVLSRNEIFLTKTIKDLLVKAQGNVEVIAMLEGYWPNEVVNDPRVHYIHSGTPRGLRGAMNAGVAIARGEFVMKVDAHCMFGPGYDTILADNCEPNWVAVPTRYRLEPENWIRTGDAILPAHATETEPAREGGRPPINYLRLDARTDRINVVLWKKKNKDRRLDADEIDDILTMQGSVFFMPKAYYHELELLDDVNYGTFRKDPQEVAFKAWCSGGRVVRNKKTWYAHLHKGRKYGRGYNLDQSDWNKGDEYVKKWWTNSAWPKQTKSFKWLMQKFSDMPGWEDFDWDLWPSGIVGGVEPKNAKTVTARGASSLLSVIIPSRNEQFLAATVYDLLDKAGGDIEVIVALDGGNANPPLREDSRIRVLHHDKPLGMRVCSNDALAIAEGDYLMKCDAHSIFDEGFDLKLIADCEDDWLVIPRRYAIIGDQWVVNGNKGPVDYEHFNYPYYKPPHIGLYTIRWRKRRDRRRDPCYLIDDNMTFQGSCWFTTMSHFRNVIGRFDAEYFGMWAGEPQEIGMKTWLSGGRVVTNKKTWHAHLYKGKRFKAYGRSKGDVRVGMARVVDYWMNDRWEGRRDGRDFEWLVDRFSPVPTWPDDWKQQLEQRPIPSWEGVMEINYG